VTETPETVTFYFDPACPWTWRTSRWLVHVAERKGVTVEYRPFELSAGGSLDDVPEQYRDSAIASRSFLRGVQAAGADGRHDVIGTWYTAYGTATFDDRSADASVDLAKRTLEEAGGSDYAAALDDTGLDADVATSREHAVSLAGDNVGSPVIAWPTGDGERGFFGPVVAPTPTGDDADQLWDAVLAMGGLPFFELKSRRTASPMG